MALHARRREIESIDGFRSAECRQDNALDLLAAAFLDVRRLDLIVDKELADDNNPLREVWKYARRVQRPRGPRSGSGDVTGSSTTPAPTPTPTDDSLAAGEVRGVSEVAGVTATEVVDAPKAATVIQMPSREAA